MDGHPAPQGTDRIPPTGRLTVATCRQAAGTPSEGIHLNLQLSADVHRASDAVRRSAYRAGRNAATSNGPENEGERRTAVRQRSHETRARVDRWVIDRAGIAAEVVVVTASGARSLDDTGRERLQVRAAEILHRIGRLPSRGPKDALH